MTTVMVQVTTFLNLIPFVVNKINLTYVENKKKPSDDVSDVRRTNPKIFKLESDFRNDVCEVKGTN